MPLRSTLRDVPSPWTAAFWLMREVDPLVRSRRKTSMRALVSAPTVRLVARLVKAM